MQVMKQFIIQFVTRRGNETYLKKTNLEKMLIQMFLSSQINTKNNLPTF